MPSTCIAILDSIHYILQAEKLLKSKRMPHEIVPVPREISSDCGMALQFDCEKLRDISYILEEKDIDLRGVYQKGCEDQKNGKDKSGYKALKKFDL
jgi:hypothetical protein